MLKAPANQAEGEFSTEKHGTLLSVMSENDVLRVSLANLDVPNDYRRGKGGGGEYKFCANSPTLSYLNTTGIRPMVLDLNITCKVKIIMVLSRHHLKRLAKPNAQSLFSYDQTLLNCVVYPIQYLP